MKIKRSGQTSQTIRASWIDRSALYMMLLPGIILLVLFQYIPKFGIILAFKNFRYDLGIFGSKWCGLDNFKIFFQTPDAWLITRNTLLYNLVFIFLGLVLSVTLAIAFNEIRGKMFAKTCQTIILMPHFLSYVIVAYLAFAFLSIENGVLNKTILPMLGMKPVNWYSESKYWPFILVFVRMWKTVGYNSIVYLAAIAGIDKSYYEAAQLDGANKWQQIIHITLPGIRGTIGLLFIMGVGGLLSSGVEQIWLLRTPGNMSLADTLDVYVLRIGIQGGQFGYATAIGLIQGVVGLVLVVVCNRICKKITEVGLW